MGFYGAYESRKNTKIHFMVKVLANFSHPETYSSPEVKVVDIVSEGVLCSSGLGINDWERDDEALDFN